MPTITISRGGGLADRFRIYGIVVDGEHRGMIRAKETHALEVSHGSHHVQLRAGILYGSPVLRVHVDERGVALSCGSSKTLRGVISLIGRPETWIWLRAAPL